MSSTRVPLWTRGSAFSSFKMENDAAAQPASAESKVEAPEIPRSQSTDTLGNSSLLGPPNSISSEGSDLCVPPNSMSSVASGLGKFRGIEEDEDRGYYSILVVSYFMWSGTSDSSGVVFQSYSVISPASIVYNHHTNTNIYPLFKNKHINKGAPVNSMSSVASGLVPANSMSSVFSSPDAPANTINSGTQSNLSERSPKLSPLFKRQVMVKRYQRRHREEKKLLSRIAVRNFGSENHNVDNEYKKIGSTNPTYEGFGTDGESDTLEFNDRSEMPSQPWFADTPSDALNTAQKIVQNVPIQAHFSFRKYTGTMSWSISWSSKQNVLVHFIDCCLRGVSQVYLINNPITGIFLLVAIGIDSMYTLLYAIVGLVASTATGFLLGAGKPSLSAGLYGYNGILTGIAVSLFSFGTSTNPSFQYLLPAALMSSFSTFIMIAVGSVLVKVLGIAPFTFPAQLTIWVWMLAAQANFQRFPIEFPSSELVLTADFVGSSFADAETYTFIQIVNGVFTGFSQVLFLENAVSGGVVLAGLLVSSIIASLSALYGSIIAVLFSMAMGVPAHSVDAGLYSYNAILTSIAIGGMFFVPSYRLIFTYDTAACLFSVVLTAAVNSALSPLGLTSLTFPFTLTSWIFILIGKANTVKGIQSISLELVTVPDNHLARYVASKRISSALIRTLGKLPFLVLKNESDLQRLENRLMPIFLCYYASIGDLNFIKKTAAVDTENAQQRLSIGDYDNRTPLMIAVANTQLPIVFYLLKHNVDVNAIDITGNTALWEAVRAKNKLMVNVLVEHGASLQHDLGNVLNQSQKTIIKAVVRNDVETLELLLEAKVDPNCRNYNNRTPLHVAASMQDRIHVIHLLLEYGANRESKDDHGLTPLMYARLSGASGKETLNFLLATDDVREKIISTLPVRQRKASISLSTATKGYEAALIADDAEIVLPALLCSAAGRNATQDVAFLLGIETIKKPKAPSNQYPDDPLQLSLHDDSINEKIFENKKKPPCSVYDIDYDNRSALAIAASKGSFQVCKLLCENGADTNSVDRWGSTPLLEILSINANSIDTSIRKKIVLLLLRYDSVMPKEEDIMYLLFNLVIQNEVSKWQPILLLKDKINFNIHDYDGWTPLHLAVKYENLESIQILMKCGADLKCKDRWGKSPYQYATQKKKVVIDTINSTKIATYESLCEDK